MNTVENALDHFTMCRVLEPWQAGMGPAAEVDPSIENFPASHLSACGRPTS